MPVIPATGQPDTLILEEFLRAQLGENYTSVDAALLVNALGQGMLGALDDLLNSEDLYSDNYQGFHPGFQNLLLQINRGCRFVALQDRCYRHPHNQSKRFRSLSGGTIETLHRKEILLAVLLL